LPPQMPMVLLGTSSSPVVPKSRSSPACRQSPHVVARPAGVQFLLALGIRSSDYCTLLLLGRSSQHRPAASPPSRYAQLLGLK
jgi:hypothetical protein